VTQNLRAHQRNHQTTSTVIKLSASHNLETGRSICFFEAVTDLPKMAEVSAPKTTGPKKMVSNKLHQPPPINPTNRSQHLPLPSRGQEDCPPAENDLFECENPEIIFLCSPVDKTTNGLAPLPYPDNNHLKLPPPAPGVAETRPSSDYLSEVSLEPINYELFEDHKLQESPLSIVAKIWPPSDYLVETSSLVVWVASTPTSSSAPPIVDTGQISSYLFEDDSEKMLSAEDGAFSVVSRVPSCSMSTTFPESCLPKENTNPDLICKSNSKSWADLDDEDEWENQELTLQNDMPTITRKQGDVDESPSTDSYSALRQVDQQLNVAGRIGISIHPILTPLNISHAIGQIPGLGLVQQSEKGIDSDSRQSRKVSDSSLSSPQPNPRTSDGEEVDHEEKSADETDDIYGLGEPTLEQLKTVQASVNGEVAGYDPFTDMTFEDEFKILHGRSGLNKNPEELHLVSEQSFDLDADNESMTVTALCNAPLLRENNEGSAAEDQTEAIQASTQTAPPAEPVEVCAEALDDVEQHDDASSSQGEDEFPHVSDESFTSHETNEGNDGEDETGTHVSTITILTPAVIAS
jgi:hypothetical protein